MRYTFLLVLCTVLATGVNRPYQISDQPDFTLITTKPITTDPLVTALILVESQGNDSAIGDKHLPVPSIGCLQIRPVMVREVNRILKLKGVKGRYKLKDRFSREKSVEMFTIWKEFHHKDDDFEKIARNWNGGPVGYRKSRTMKYWVKVQKYLSDNTLVSEE